MTEIAKALELLTPEQLAARYSPEQLRRLRGMAAPSFIRDEAPFASGVSFWDRLGLGFERTPEGQEAMLEQMGHQPQRLQSGELGVVKTRPSGRQVVHPVDVAGMPEMGDLADIVGEIPGGLMAFLGGTAGAASPVLGGAFLGATAAGGVGDLLRQKIAQSLGSGQPISGGQIATEAALSGGGELLGGILQKGAGGPLRASTQADDFAGTMGKLRNFDTRFGTGLEGQAPIDVQSGSGFMGNLSQRVRESQFGGQKFRQAVDEPFQRELDAGFEALRRESGAVGPASTVGPYARPVGERQAGRNLRQAAIETRQARTATRQGLYDDFAETVDPAAVPDLTHTQQAIAEIRNTDIMKRTKTGAGGLEDLRSALDEAEGLATFDDLVRHRKAVADEIGQWDPTRMARGSEGLMKKLRGALQADEDAFLGAGGAGGGPGVVTPLGMRAPKKLTPRQARQLDELSIIDADLRTPKQQATYAKLKKLDGGGVLKLSDVYDHPALYDHYPFLRNIRVSLSENPWPALFGDEITLPRGYWIEDPTYLRHEIAHIIQKKKGASSSGAPWWDKGHATNLGEVEAREWAGRELYPGEKTSAIEAGTKARTYARDLFNIDEASSARRIFRDELKLSDIPEALPRMNADEIAAVKRVVGQQGTEGGVTATKQGREAWEGVAAEVLDDLKRLARNPDASTPDNFVISGTRLQRALDKYKPGALDEIFGAETAADLRQFADMVKSATVSERNFANFSKTSMAEQSVLHDLAQFFVHPAQTAGKIVGRYAADKGVGWALRTPGVKNYLLGNLGFQQSPGLLGALGRAGGQAGVRYGANRTGAGRP